MAEPRDQMPAATRRGDMLAADTDREQAVASLKAAFVQGRLTMDEFDLRVGQALAARTYAGLAAVTADLPAVPSAAPSRPAQAPRRSRVLQRPESICLGPRPSSTCWF